MTLKELRIASGMARKEFAEFFGINYRTVQKWELHDSGSPEGRKCPEYLQNLMQYKLEKEGILSDKHSKHILTEEMKEHMKQNGITPEKLFFGTKKEGQGN